MKSKLYDLLCKMIEEYNENSRMTIAYSAAMQMNRLSRTIYYLKSRKDRSAHRMEACYDYS